LMNFFALGMLHLQMIKLSDHSTEDYLFKLFSREIDWHLTKQHRVNYIYY
jgi:hypothetical protein